MLAEMAEFAPFATVKDYDNWISRINASSLYVDQWILQFTQGTQERLTQPRVIIQKVLEQIKGPLTADPEANPFYAPFKKMPAGIPDAEKARLPPRQDRGAGRRDPGVPALRQVLPRRLSTRVA